MHCSLPGGQVSALLGGALICLSEFYPFREYE